VSGKNGTGNNDAGNNGTNGKVGKNSTLYYFFICAIITCATFTVPFLPKIQIATSYWKSKTKT